ncbi:hypothetical protein H6P81_021686 [Aristolochia fimbriata]|uniref:Uncharacterized protein n=1 Tax=Aristolochia fimbriata TaxID=158543 RepID=A0AAV7DQV7_ARIFI|nr:hypothetical protein H6P81_021686 [Aristolochia fimbriata]
MIYTVSVCHNGLTPAFTQTMVTMISDCSSRLTTRRMALSPTVSSTEDLVSAQLRPAHQGIHMCSTPPCSGLWGHCPTGYCGIL